MKQDIFNARKHSADHRAEIMASTRCRCFQCLESFGPEKIVKWVDDDRTALCPYCGVDAVLGDASGLTLDDALITKMHQHWF
ncbi:MAG: cytoplasmic protein [Methylobacterium mesophilicum]|nr:cytoplasmic protein [Methylobacterium mesophilicum]